MTSPFDRKVPTADFGDRLLTFDLNSFAADKEQTEHQSYGDVCFILEYQPTLMLFLVIHFHKQTPYTASSFDFLAICAPSTLRQVETFAGKSKILIANMETIEETVD